MTLANNTIYQAAYSEQEDSEGVWKPELQICEEAHTDALVHMVISNWEKHSGVWGRTEEGAFDLINERVTTMRVSVNPDAFMLHLGIAYGIALEKLHPEHLICVRLLGFIYRLAKEKVRIFGVPVML